MRHLPGLMTRRVRTFAGLLALVAMIASLSQAVLASLCASPAAMASMPDMVTSMESNDGGQSSDGHRMACDWMGRTGESRENGQPCPLAPAATQGCTATASAPAPALVVALITPRSVGHAMLDAIEPELLLTDALYHPPRA